VKINWINNLDDFAFNLEIIFFTKIIYFCYKDAYIYFKNISRNIPIKVIWQLYK
jgi:hypothetical protein